MAIIPFNYNFASTLSAGQLARPSSGSLYDSWSKFTQSIIDAPWKDPADLVSEPSSAEAGEMHQPVHGQVIPVFRGTVKGGRVFWFNGPEERDAGVYADFAVAIARNEWQEPGVLLDIRADDTLIYDARRGGRTSGKFTLRIYDGIENDFDPEMLAVNGESQTPAYHGLIYLFFEDFRCTEYGNRIPIIRATWTDTPEAASGSDGTLDLLATTALGYEQDATAQPTKQAYDRTLDHFYEVYRKAGDATGLYLGTTAFDDSRLAGTSAGEISLVKISGGPIADITHISGTCAIPGTGLILTTGSKVPFTTNYQQLLIDADTGVIIASDNTDLTQHVTWRGALRFQGAGDTTYIAAGHSTWDSSDLRVAFAAVDVADPSITILQYGTDEIGNGDDFPIITPGFSNSTGLVHYVMAGGVGASIYEARFTEIGLPTYTLIYTPGASEFIDGMFYDPGTDSIIISVEVDQIIGPTEARRINRTTGAVVWAVQVDASAISVAVVSGGGEYDSDHGLTFRLRPGYAILRNAGDTRLMDLTDGSTEDLPLVSGIDADHYDQFSGAAYGLFEDEWRYNGTSRWEPGEITIAEILTDFSTYDGLLTDAQVTTSGLAGLTCHGVYIDRDSDLRELAAKICELYGIDKVETGTGVKFVKKATDDLFTPDVEIAEADLVETRSGDITTLIQSRRRSETEIVQEVEIQYRDVDLDYNVATASASRPTGIFQSTQSTLRKTLDVPLVLDTTAAARLAPPLLYRHVAGQTAHSFTVSRRHLAIEPSDVVEATADGYVRLLKAERVVKRADNTQEITAEEYLSRADVTVVAPTVILQSTPAVGTGHARYIHLDGPLLRYNHDLGGAGIVSYAVLTSRGSPDWPGASLWRRRAGADWDRPYRVGAPAPTVCVAQAALPAPPVTFETDLVNTLTVRLLTGDGAELVDTTYLAMMEGANRFALGKPGRWMIGGFQNITSGSPSDGTFTIDTIMQGLRGTEVFQGTSVAGDWFIPLRPDLFGAVRYELSDLDDAIQFAGRGRNVPFDEVVIETHTISGAAETPYAPASLDAVKDGVDIDLSCKRRTRLMWEWYDEGSAVEGPLGEAVELYKYEILDGPGGAVLRTYLNEPLETKTYVAAHITADFGSMPDVLTFRVSQWSAVVGWGYAAEATVGLV